MYRPCWTPDCQDRKRRWFKDKRLSRRRLEKISKLEAVEGDTRLLSKFGGVEPWLDPEVGWPKCPVCKNVKTFICQFLIKDLPEYLK